MQEFQDGMGYAPETDEELDEGLEEDQEYSEIYDSEDPDFEDAEDGEEIIVEVECDNELPVILPVEEDEEDTEGNEDSNPDDYDPRDDPDFYEDENKDLWKEGDPKEKEDPDLEDIVEAQNDNNN